MNGEQQLPYSKLLYKKENFVIVSQTVSRTPVIHYYTALYLYHMNYYAILKDHLQVLDKLHPKYF